MKILTAFLLVVLALSLAGCGTPYTPVSANGGHSFKRLGPDSFEITFLANNNLYSQRFRDLAKLRACEVTLDHGYNFFIIEAEEYDEMERTFPSMASTTVATSTTTPGSSSSGGSSSGSSTSAPTTTTTIVTPINRSMYYPRIRLTIRCFINPPTSIPHAGIWYDAERWREDLAVKHQIEI